MLIGREPVGFINPSISRSLADVRQSHFFFYAIPREMGKGRNGNTELNRRRIILSEIHKDTPFRQEKNDFK